MIVELTHDPIDVSRLIRHVTNSGNGAVCTFHGIVRDNAEGKAVTKLYYDAYESMALRQMQRLVDEAVGRWAVNDVALVHRTGELQIGESSVVIAVGSPHRAAAFDACRHIIDTLKTTVPIWKQEFFENGSVWVDPAPQPVTD
jgi:molybdopterin synthase catalytic subunit